MMLTAVIMAGGQGERFWPMSRKALPKQFIRLLGDKTMLQLTVERISGLVDIDKTFVVTSQAYAGLVAEQLPGLPKENIVIEPQGRNTAPCIGLAAAVLERRFPAATMVVLPADHYIGDVEAYCQTLKAAAELAEQKDCLVTIGIKPSRPETGYGYIRAGEEAGVYNSINSYAVDRFVEKPDYDRAVDYLASGIYWWNSGIFVWRVATIRKAIDKYLPRLSGCMNIVREKFGSVEFADALRDAYQQTEKTSIDFGIMERSGNIFVLPGSFNWDDVGSWPALSRLRELDKDGNVTDGLVVTHDTKDCVILGDKRLITTVGIKDLIIVDTGDTTLICDKRQAQEIKLALELIKKQGLEQYL